MSPLPEAALRPRSGADQRRVSAPHWQGEQGAAGVIVAATHAILSDPARDRLQNSDISEVIVTDTLPIVDEARFPKLTVLSIAPLLAKAITEVFTDGSVTSMFDDTPSFQMGN